MKKNILTIIIMAIVLINTVLTGVILFTIVPAATETYRLVDKVSSIIDLELESPSTTEAELTIEDITSYEFPDPLQIPLKSNDGASHYAVFNVSLSMNNKHKDYTVLSAKLTENENAIAEIVQTEFAKYTKDEIDPNKEKIKDNVRTGVQDLFQSDFIINVTFGNILTQ